MSKDCAVCKGTGELTVSVITHYAFDRDLKLVPVYKDVVEICWHCHGSGEEEEDETK